MTTWDTSRTWDNIHITWDDVQLLIEIIDTGGGSSYDAWAHKNKEKKKKAIKLVMDFNGSTIEMKKEYKKLKVKVDDVDINVEEIVRRVEKIIFMTDK